MARLFWLSDKAWACLEPHLLHGRPGKPRVDDRRLISGILHMLKTGRRQRDAPKVWSGRDRLQPLQPVVTTRVVAAPVRAGSRVWSGVGVGSSARAASLI